MPDPVETARRRLRAATAWHDDRLATLHWWTDPELLRLLGPGLAGLHSEARPTLVAGVQSSGYLLAPLVAIVYGAGMLGIQQHRHGPAITLATADGTPGPDDRVLLVDDVVETGAQAAAVRDIVTGAGATWLGAAAMVEYRAMPELNLRSLSSISDLP